jgi:Fe-S-cluster containining protein
MGASATRQRRLPQAVDYDCQSCGACCVPTYDVESYVHLLQEDVDRLDAAGQLEDLAVQTNRYGPIRYEDPHWALLTKTQTQPEAEYTVCKALSGPVGKDCSCSIYDSRPKACIDFQPGSLYCQAAREEIGLDRKPVA